jgi:hypothetical protein
MMTVRVSSRDDDILTLFLANFHMWGNFVRTSIQHAWRTFWNEVSACCWIFRSEWLMLEVSQADSSMPDVITFLIIFLSANSQLRALQEAGWDNHKGSFDIIQIFKIVASGRTSLCKIPLWCSQRSQAIWNSFKTSRHAHCVLYYI